MRPKEVVDDADNKVLSHDDRFTLQQEAWRLAIEGLYGIEAQILEGLSAIHPYIPMSVGYLVPSFSRKTLKGKKYFDAIQHLAGLHEEKPFFSEDGQSLLSGADLSNKIIFERPEYYPRLADARIITDPMNRDAFIRHLYKANVVNFGVGSGVKEQLLLRTVAPWGYTREAPFRCWNIDIVEENLSEARRVMARAPYPKKAIREVCGDFHGDALWKDKFWKKIRKDREKNSKEKRPILLTMLGLTIGNFSEEQRRDWLMNVNHAMRREDRVMISGDNTRHEPTVRAAYEAFCYQQFFMCGFLFALDRVGLEGIDYRALDCSIDFGVKRDAQRKEVESIHIVINIINNQDQELHFRTVIDEKSMDEIIILRKGKISVGWIEKLNASIFQQEFAKYGFQQIDQMPFRYSQHDVVSTVCVEAGLWFFKKVGDIYQPRVPSAEERSRKAEEFLRQPVTKRQVFHSRHLNELAY